MCVLYFRNQAFYSVNTEMRLMMSKGAGLLVTMDTSNSRKR